MIDGYTYNNNIRFFLDFIFIHVYNKIELANLNKSVIDTLHIIFELIVFIY